MVLYLRPFLHFRSFSSIPVARKKRWDWCKLAWESEKKYHQEVKLRLEGTISGLQVKVLQLQNNFNLRGALEFSLNEYKTIHKVPETGNTKILHHLINDTEYQGCLADVTKRYQLQTADINACASTLYHELSKHAHGNTAELAVIGSEHPITEVAALEAVFCALKKKGCFSLPMKFYFRNEEREL